MQLQTHLSPGHHPLEAFIGLHAGIYLTTEAYLFSPLMIAGWVALLPRTAVAAMHALLARLLDRVFAAAVMRRALGHRKLPRVLFWGAAKHSDPTLKDSVHSMIQRKRSVQ